KASKKMKVVVVISALDDVTDLLLNAATNAKIWDSTQVIHFIDRIRGIHSRPLTEMGLRQATYNEAMDHLEELLDDLKLTLSSVSILRELTPRSNDLLLSLGETPSLGAGSAGPTPAGTAIEPPTGGRARTASDHPFRERRPRA